MPHDWLSKWPSFAWNRCVLFPYGVVCLVASGKLENTFLYFFVLFTQGVWKSTKVIPSWDYFLLLVVLFTQKVQKSTRKYFPVFLMYTTISYPHSFLYLQTVLFHLTSVLYPPLRCKSLTYPLITLPYWHTVVLPYYCLGTSEIYQCLILHWGSYLIYRLDPLHVHLIHCIPTLLSTGYGPTRCFHWQHLIHQACERWQKLAHLQWACHEHHYSPRTLSSPSGNCAEKQDLD